MSVEPCMDQIELGHIERISELESEIERLRDQKDVWQPIETAPTDGRRLWISDGKEVWHIMAHADSSHKSAPLCKFWMTAVWPDPPSE